MRRMLPQGPLALMGIVLFSSLAAARLPEEAVDSGDVAVENEDIPWARRASDFPSTREPLPEVFSASPTSRFAWIRWLLPALKATCEEYLSAGATLKLRLHEGRRNPERIAAERELVAGGLEPGVANYILDECALRRNSELRKTALILRPLLGRGGTFQSLEQTALILDIVSATFLYNPTVSREALVDLILFYRQRLPELRQVLETSLRLLSLRPYANRAQVLRAAAESKSFDDLRLFKSLMKFDPRMAN